MEPDFSETAGACLPAGTVLRRIDLTGPWTDVAAVAVPARDEEKRVGGCVESLAAARMTDGRPVTAVVLVNDSEDATFECAVARARACGLAALVADVTLSPSCAHAGAARGAALDLAARFGGRGAVLMTTDADTRVTPDWLRANHDEIARGAALVCGRIDIDPAEAPARSVESDAADALEARYLRLMRELEASVDPDPVNPWPHHGMIGGASLAMKAGGYAAVGGLPRLALGEDRALLAAFRARDLPVRHSDLARVITSGRMRGRAAGGMADTLRRRAADADAPIDVMAEPAVAWHARLRARALARALHASGDGVARLARELGLSAPDAEKAAGEAFFGAAWRTIEEKGRLAARRPLRPSELPPEMARLEWLISGRARRSGSDEPAPASTGGHGPVRRLAV